MKLLLHACCGPCACYPTEKLATDGIDFDIIFFNSGNCFTEFFNEKHPMPDTPDDFVGDGNEGMFAFKKQMRL